MGERIEIRNSVFGEQKGRAAPERELPIVGAWDDH